MRITNVKCDLYRIPLGHELSDAIQRISALEYVMTTIQTDAGITGTGWTYTGGTGGLALRTYVVNNLAPLVTGQDANDVDRLWHRMWWGNHIIGSSGLTNLAISSVDIALWDIIAKSRKLPLYRALGGHREHIPIYGSGINLYYPLDELVQQTRDFLAEGVRGIKMKVGRPDLGDDLERLRAVRDVIGPSMPLYVDGNQGWSVAEAINRARAYEPFNLSWLEEPILADDHVGYEVLAQSVNIPLAAGETHYNRYEFADLMERKALGFVQADVCRCGGITEWMKIAHLAETYNLPMAPHAVEELHTHLTCAVLNGYIVEHIFKAGGTTDTLIVDPPTSQDGYFTPPQTPGHGIVFRPEILKKGLVK